MKTVWKMGDPSQCLKCHALTKVEVGGRLIESMKEEGEVVSVVEEE